MSIKIKGNPLMCPTDVAAIQAAQDTANGAMSAAENAQSTAQAAQTSADGKVSKNGDTMTGNLAVPTVNGTSIPANGGTACVTATTGHVYETSWEGSKSIASRTGTLLLGMTLPAGTYVISAEVALAESITGSIWFSGISNHAQGCFGAGHANKFFSFVCTVESSASVNCYVYTTAAATCTKALMYANRIQ